MDAPRFSNPGKKRSPDGQGGSKPSCSGQAESHDDAKHAELIDLIDMTNQKSMQEIKKIMQNEKEERKKDRVEEKKFLTAEHELALEGIKSAMKRWILEF